MNQLLFTKLFIPKPRPELVPRTRLLKQLNDGIQRKLTLISAPAGFGKTTLISEWVEKYDHPVAWLSLENEDSSLTRFLTYLVTAIQTILPDVGKDVLSDLQSPQPPLTESILTALLNQIAEPQDDFYLVLDDYHVIESKPVDETISFLIEHLPPHMHLIITTREDPNLPLARYRVRGQLSEIRVADLRFTNSETAHFFNEMMGLTLTEKDIAALERRTEGWIAGLQLAAISLQGEDDTSRFIESFTGSHHFVLDYLVEEVLQKQSEKIQSFLLQTSILDRLCGSLCDAVLGDPSVSGQETLAYLECANLFITPLDNKRQWYRYHHLFADLLRQRLYEKSTKEVGSALDVTELHIRASQWYEENGLEIEAFEHAAAANDLERAERLMEGKGMPLQYRGAMVPVMNWLESLPADLMDSRPSLWVAYASTLTMIGKQVNKIEEIVQSAENALQTNEPDEKNRDLLGQVAAIRAMIAIPQNQVETIISQANRALQYLSPENLSVRTSTMWSLGYAYQLQGNRTEAAEAHQEALSISLKSGNTMISLAALTSLGQINFSDNKLNQAEEYYKKVLQLAGDPPLPVACESHFGLAQIYYQWNDLETAQKHGDLSSQLAKKLENVDTPVKCELVFAQINLARKDINAALENLNTAERLIQSFHFSHLLPDVITIRMLILLNQGNISKAAELVNEHNLPLSQARVNLARGDATSALEILTSYRQEMEHKGWLDEQLKVIILLALTQQSLGNEDQALKLLEEALNLAEPGGLICIFVNEGSPMVNLLTKAAAQGMNPIYISKILAAFNAQDNMDGKTSQSILLPLNESLSERELEILQLIAQGLSNREISKRLFLALNTIKGYNQKIFGKLQVQRRTEAVAKARELNLL